MTYEQIFALFLETRAQIQTLTEKTDRQIAETGKQIQVLTEKTDWQLAETSAEVAKTSAEIKAVNKRVGEISDTLGQFAEEQLRPKILALFREHGIELEETIRGVRVERNGQFLLEIDLLLVNTVYSVVVEVKNKLKHEDIDDHIERLKKLQKSPSRAVKGTTMYGAVAGMIVKDEVEKYAIKKGLYVIKTKGDNVEIANKRNFKPTAWKIQSDDKS